MTDGQGWERWELVPGSSAEALLVLVAKQTATTRPRERADRKQGRKNGEMYV